MKVYTGNNSSLADDLTLRTFILQDGRGWGACTEQVRARNNMHRLRQGMQELVVQPAADVCRSRSAAWGTSVTCVHGATCITQAGYAGVGRAARGRCMQITECGMGDECDENRRFFHSIHVSCCHGETGAVMLGGTGVSHANRA